MVSQDRGRATSAPNETLRNCPSFLREVGAVLYVLSRFQPIGWAHSEQNIP